MALPYTVRAVGDAGPYAATIGRPAVGGGVLDAPPYNALSLYRRTASAAVGRNPFGSKIARFCASFFHVLSLSMGLRLKIRISRLPLNGIRG